MGFVHLHVASAYSMRYGVGRPEALARRAAELGMDTLALTDRDGLYGAIKHIRACQEAGIRPIVGAEIHDPGQNWSDEASSHPDHGTGRVVVLAREGGWGELCRLVSAVRVGDPRPASGGGGGPLPELAAGRGNPAGGGSGWAGLTVLLGPSSGVGVALAERRPDLAAERLAAWRERTDVVIELVDLLGQGESHLAARMLAFARDAGVPAVLTNQVRYLRPDQAHLAEVLDAVRTKTPLAARYGDRRSAQAYLKSAEGMRAVAERICGPGEDAVRLLADTRSLAERCVLDPVRDLGMGQTCLPSAAEPGDAVTRLRVLAAEGISRRGMGQDERAQERLEYELGIIRDTGLAAYFLVVADVAALIRERGIRCAIRGSGAGSLVNYLLGIGDIDPLAHGLLMERFLSEGRGGLPDIDLDVESARRLEAYQAIFDRYGEGCVATVSMMETYRARSAIRDVGAALGLPADELGTIAKAFPHIPAHRIRTALRDLPELRNIAEPRLARLFRIAGRLGGLPRHVAMHPCGIVLSDATLAGRSPVERSRLGFPMTQFDKDDVEAMGLLKLDVIGVRMQSAMAHARDEIARASGEEIDLEAIPPGDPETYTMIRTGRTLGCFQIESPGQRELVAKLEPRDLGDLIIDISLFRPGPVNSDMITPYLEARHGWKPPAFPHPDLQDILRESQGVVVFHEQVLRILDMMTGCGLAEADRKRRLLATDSDIVGEWFRAAARREGYDAATIEKVWKTLTAFGAFGFCKAHAASFALPTYQSAWLKRHHTAAFFAGVLTHEPGMYPKRAILDDARHFGVPILPLDVNRSAASWRVEALCVAGEQDDAGPCPLGLRVALSEVKGIREAEVARIVARRPYASVADFRGRARVSRRTAERIVLAGGFDALAGAPRRDPLRESMSVVAAELEILGLDVSRHVLSFYDGFLGELGVVRARDLLGHRAGEEVLVAGAKIATQTPAVRSGQRIIFATVEDSTGPVDATFFESVQEECAATLFASWLLVVRGTIRRTGGQAVSLIATGCWDLRRLERTWRRNGGEAVRELLAERPKDRRARRRSRIVYGNGFAMSPYADVAPPDSSTRSWT